MTTQEYFEKMADLWETFETEHNGETKAAKARARKAIGELKKLITDYRKQSVNESK